MTVDQWRKCLTVLDEGQSKRLLKSLDIVVSPEDELEPLIGLKMAVADWVAHLGLFTDAQIYQLLSAIDNPLKSFANTLNDTEVPVFTLVICDGRWASCSGKEHFFDLQEYEEIEQLPEYSITHIMCDVTQLYARMEYRVNRMGNGKEASDVNN